MKKILSMIIALMVVSGVVSARRLDNPSASESASVVKSGSTFKLSYKREALSTVKVSIYNENNKLVFTETIRKISSFVRPYNFSGLPEGAYTIEIADGDSKVIESINYQKDHPTTFAILTPVKGEATKYVLSMANAGKEAVTVNIYNEDGTLQYSESEIVNGEFAKVYDLKKVKGKFSVEVVGAEGKVKTLAY